MSQEQVADSAGEDRPPFPQEYRCGIPFPISDRGAVQAARKALDAVTVTNKEGKTLRPHELARIARFVLPPNDLVCDWARGEEIDYWVWLLREVWSAGWWAGKGKQEPRYCDPENRGCTTSYCLRKRRIEESGFEPMPDNRGKA